MRFSHMPVPVIICPLGNFEASEPRWGPNFFRPFFFCFFFVQFLWMLFNWEDHSFLWNQLQVKTSFISFILENWVAVEQFQSLIMKRQASLEMNRQLTLWYSTLSNTPLVSFLRKSKLKFITVRLISHTAQD